jgi:hypothetical protein
MQDFMACKRWWATEKLAKNIMEVTEPTKYCFSAYRLAHYKLTILIEYALSPA